VTAWELLNEPDPREIQRKAEASTSLEEVYSRWTVSEDPEEHAKAIEAYFEAGVTDVFVQRTGRPGAGDRLRWESRAAVIRRRPCSSRSPAWSTIP
jgi:alkanesulfonate monooxygenase SsuD/methylene tetrahydromethanopterin reductase-like flavin-dependent oxidoreductase (luciferase family)